MRRGYGKAAENTGKPYGTGSGGADGRYGRKVQRNPHNMGNGYVTEKYLPLVAEVPLFSELLGKTTDCMAGSLPMKEWKGLLSDARKVSAAEKEPVREAAARAIITACGTWQTPTNALGFCFYGVAAMAYYQVGTAETKEIYDMLATKELEQILASLKQVKTSPDEQAAKLQWNC